VSYDAASEIKKAIEATVMTPVASQPKTTHGRSMRNGPIIFLLVAICMTTNITGTATTALSAAAQINALMGLIYRTIPAAPTRVAVANAA
jgi:hypothetical protein